MLCGRNCLETVGTVAAAGGSVTACLRILVLCEKKAVLSEAIHKASGGDMYGSLCGREH